MTKNNKTIAFLSRKKRNKNLNANERRENTKETSTIKNKKTREPTTSPTARIRKKDLCDITTKR